MTRSFAVRAAVVAFTALMVSACEHVGPLDSGALEPTLASIQTNIFATSCALSNCHVGQSAPRGLDLSAGAARDNLVNVPSGGVPAFMRVEPGNADDSYLVMKLEGDPRIVGLRMPLNEPPLPAEQIGVVREWIDNGAQ